MPIGHELKLKHGLRMLAAAEQGGSLSLRLLSQDGKKPPDCILHWGVCAETSSTWRLPPEFSHPADTKPVGAAAAETPFKPVSKSLSVIDFTISDDLPYKSLEFVLFFPNDKRWDNNNGKNYRIELRSMPEAAESELINELPAIDGGIAEINHTFEDGRRLCGKVTAMSGGFALDIYTNLAPPVVLHWGVASSRGGRWLAPSDEIPAPDGSVRLGTAVDSHFDFAAGYGRFHVEFPDVAAPPYFTFVLHLPSSGKWLKCSGQNFYCPIAPNSGAIANESLSQYADEIINAEMGKGSMTLMHRFNMCYGMCERLGADVDGFALLTVWLRYSAIRQLDWQRNYNTQPRELSHAQERLTLKLAEIYLNTPQVRPFIPLMLMMMGPGGDGQRIRDEILQIMHRHHVKEVSGHFLEEWHQKLHNNTTADDIVICEAYLAFLRSNGDRGRFYETLNAGGVTEERLRGFERPIRSQPDFVPHIKDGLIYDFENYLKTLKAVHSSTDLDRALNTASHLFDSDIKNALHFIGKNKDASDIGRVKDLFATATWVRGRLRHLINAERDTYRAREMLLLDLSIVEFIRLLAERSQHMDKSALVELVILAAENMAGSAGALDEELRICSSHLKTMPRQDAHDWLFHIISVTERLERAIGSAVEWYYKTFQEKAETLGRAFNAAAWTINLFTEELLRGQPPFVLSMLLKRLNQILRKEYNLGAWQVVSPFGAVGKVAAVDTLYEIQDKTFDTLTVIVAAKVSGDEEIPAHVAAVISPDMTDIVSHVAVRARNARVLFATCYDPATLDTLKGLSGRYVSLTINQSGGIDFNETAAPSLSETASLQGVKHVLKAAPVEFTAFALPMKAFNRRVAGGKSANLAALRGNIADWINLPPSVVIPFGAMDKILSANPEIDAQYSILKENLNLDTLPRLRTLIETLKIPDEYMAELKAVMLEAGLSYPEADEGRAAGCIKQVWASLWNERAYHSRVNNFVGNPHEGVSMAVLIQEIVKADYAFVIHTVNPITGARDEIFAEMVLGLGETLVGNHPGRAMSFTAKKDGGALHIAAYPGKSYGLYADGLIFRSDSNVEDLSGFAGAGLYDSITMRKPQRVLLDYSTNPLLKDEAFRVGLLSKIKDIGVIVETAFGSPQDIEGAYADGRYYVLQSRPQVGI
ncbi:MAG: hypothetical protein L7F77_07780 [Candidatus Magnetominusculus sp. LBB02]|nr:hypothetical protein [Candidatus Magnetominusculus sp. LBB02]